MSYTVESAWLFDQLQSGNKVIIADCQYLLSNSEQGKQDYLSGHLPGAIYVDLSKDLSAPIAQHGGRHPLPEADVLAQRLGQLGIDRHTPVVAYDNQGGMMAARFWWILHYLGHDQAYVLIGGIARWSADGFPVESGEAATREPRQFEISPRIEQLVSREELKSRLGNTDFYLIDSREPKRYLGEEEAIDRAAGHIPGAVNFFWKDVLTEEGSWKEKLQTHFGDVPADKEIIVYCGSGVSACPNVISLKEAGYTNIRLYAGSWSDWISYEDGDIATGSE